MSIDFGGLEKVKQGDLRVGDVIVPVYKDRGAIGEEVETVRDGDGDLETDKDFYDPDLYDFYLVRRAPLALPTKVGSVVHVRRSEGAAGARWILMSDLVWTSTAGIRKDEALFREFVEDRIVEVVA